MDRRGVGVDLAPLPPRNIQSQIISGPAWLWGETESSEGVVDFRDSNYKRVTWEEVKS